MKIIKEVNTRYDFEFWGGAADTVKYLTDDEIEEIIPFLEEWCPDGMTETQLNDYFWFERNDIAKLLGYDDFELIMKREI